MSELNPMLQLSTAPSAPEPEAPAAVTESIQQTAAPAEPEAPKAKALTAEQYDWLYETYMPPTVSESSYEENLKKLGDTDFAGNPRLFGKHIDMGCYELQSGAATMLLLQ